MKRANILESKLVALFRSGADEEHTADEMQELLEGIDFQALLQAVYSMRETVYEYRVDSDMEKGFVYRGPELFPGKAVLLYTDDGYGCYDVALHEQAYELWLLPDATFVVVSRIRSAIGNDASVMEYRTIKRNAFDIERFLSHRLKMKPEEQYQVKKVDLSGEPAAEE